MFAVVLAFSDQHLTAFLHYMGYVLYDTDKRDFSHLQVFITLDYSEVPYVGVPLQNLLRKFFENQKRKLHSEQIPQV